MDIKEMTIGELERIVLDKSEPLNNSTAFQLAISYIKGVNLDMYRTLLEKECEEIGVEDW